MYSLHPYLKHGGSEVTDMSITEWWEALVTPNNNLISIHSIYKFTPTSAFWNSGF
jgi:hypothetical protein